jgi:hypothetical protein
MSWCSKRVVFLLVLLFGLSISPASGNSTYLPCGPNGETFEIRENSYGKTLANGRKCVGVVVIPDGVVHIDSSTFLGAKITHIEMPDSVKSLSPQVFSGSTITSVKLSNSLIEIPKGAFEGTSLNEVVIPDSVTLIRENAFTNSKLTRVILGKSLIYLGSGAFAGNSLLKYIFIPSSLQSFGVSPLSFSKNLERIDYCGPLYKPDTLSGLFLITPTCDNINNPIVAVAELKAKQAAELKAKKEAEAKAAAVAAANKKTTITCVKGKLTKKVTAVKPKCPSGYKVK